MPLKIALTTLGCKVNQVETAIMREQLLKHGFEPVPFNQPADVYIINTCTVTGKSDFQSRQLIRQAIRCNNSAYIVVTGCYAQVNYQDIRRIQGVDLILGNSEKLHIDRYLTDLEKVSPPKIIIGDRHSDQSHKAHPQISSFMDHTRAFVKIQDGCNQACSYCIVPQVRGRSRSQPVAAVKRQVKRLIEAGYKEIVLTGIHIGAYGQDLSPRVSLAGLLRELVKLEKLGYIRLSSIEPNEFSDELIAILQSEKICPHLHIPLQSAHEGQLKSMNRPYSPDQYQKLVNRLADNIPHLALGCDIIVGFPGETPAIFEHNYQFIDQLPLAYLHVFRFSPRPNTAAANFAHQVDGKLKKERSQRLRNLSRQKSVQYRQRYLGKIRPALVLNKRDEQTGWFNALTDNYIKLMVSLDEQYINQIVPVQISSIKDGRTLGKLVTRNQNLSQHLV
jgi:threonylcarbamoyladenosine tRNA methylthiotransferase MtaB